MTAYEYSVIPAPSRGEKARGAKTPIDRFALSLASVLNDMAAEGWEYVRAETLPSEERAGLTSRAMVYHNVLIFRRSLETEDLRHDLLVGTDTVAPAYQPHLAAPAEPAPQIDASADSTATRAPFSEPMRPVSKPLAAPAETPRPRFIEPRLTTSVQPAGPRLGPASR